LRSWDDKVVDCFPGIPHAVFILKFSFFEIFYIPSIEIFLDFLLILWANNNKTNPKIKFRAAHRQLFQIDAVCLWASFPAFPTDCMDLSTCSQKWSSWKWESWQVGAEKCLNNCSGIYKHN